MLCGGGRSIFTNFGRDVAGALKCGIAIGWHDCLSLGRWQWRRTAFEFFRGLAATFLEMLAVESRPASAANAVVGRANKSGGDAGSGNASVGYRISSGSCSDGSDLRHPC